MESVKKNSEMCANIEFAVLQFTATCSVW